MLKEVLKRYSAAPTDLMFDGGAKVSHYIVLTWHNFLFVFNCLYIRFFSRKSSSSDSAIVIFVHYFLLRRPTSGERMLIALLVTGILIATIVLLVIFSAIQDLADDY